MRKLVSIVVAVYNAEDCLSRCLDSLLTQTYTDIEVICVNDASTDNSQSIINDYINKDNRVRTVIHNQNMNAGGAMNDGIKAAKGEYVCIVDNDDWLEKTAIEELIKASDNCSIDIVACDWYDYLSEDEIKQNTNLTDSCDWFENNRYALLYGFRLLGCLIRKSIFIKNNLFFPEKVFYEDNAICNCILFYAHSIKPLHKGLYYYFLSEGSVTRSGSIKKYEDRVYTTDLFLENLEKRGFVDDKTKELIEYRYLRLLFSTIYRLTSFSGKGGSKIAKKVARRMASKMPNHYIHELCGSFENSFKHPMRYYWISRIRNFCKI